MISVNNWEERKAHYEEYWNMKNKTPVIYLASQVDDPTPVELPDIPWQERMYDTDYMIKDNRGWFHNAYYGLDAYPYVSPTLGNDLLSALLGLELKHTEASTWVVHSDKPLSEFHDFHLDESSHYFQAMKKILTDYAEDAKNGDYIVGMVDLNTLMDGVSSLIGPENLCYEMVDDPDEVKRVTLEHLEFYKKVYTIYNDIVTRYQGGSTNWLSVYSQVPWYFISIDFMVMVSGEFFDEFIADPLSQMIDFHGRTLFHLDGENAVKHLDRVLEQKKLTGVQVQATPYMQSAEFWIPHLKKIQKAGKTMWVAARHKQDVEDYIKNLEPEGMFLSAWCGSVAEAKEIEKLVSDYYGMPIRED